MERKALLVLAVAFLAVGVVVGFAGSATAANVPADGSGTTSSDCGSPTEPFCNPGGGGGGGGGGDGGDCSDGPEPLCPS